MFVSLTQNWGHLEDKLSNIGFHWRVVLVGQPVVLLTALQAVHHLFYGLQATLLNFFFFVGQNKLVRCSHSLDQGILKWEVSLYHWPPVWFGISCMTTGIVCFYLQNRLIQTSQTGGQQYGDTSPFSIPYLDILTNKATAINIELSPFQAEWPEIWKIRPILVNVAKSVAKFSKLKLKIAPNSFWNCFLGKNFKNGQVKSSQMANFRLILSHCLQVFHCRVGSWRYRQTIDLAEKALQEQTL
jgi:hypothetical protein